MKFFIKLIGKVSSKIAAYCDYLIQYPQSKRVKSWFADNGDENVRLNYPMLNKDAVIFDLGGYKGQWASDIYARYNSTIYIFEPSIAFANKIKDRFSANNNVLVFPFGLGKKDEALELAISNNASSTFKKGSGATERIEIKAINVFLQKYSIKNIALMKINIEGGEYDLLESLIDSGTINSIDNIQVQFHDFVPNAEERMVKIQQQLVRTHYLTFQYPFVWENWKRK